MQITLEKVLSVVMGFTVLLGVLGGLPPESVIATVTNGVFPVYIYILALSGLLAAINTQNTEGNHLVYVGIFTGVLFLLVMNGSDLGFGFWNNLTIGVLILDYLKKSPVFLLSILGIYLLAYMGLGGRTDIAGLAVLCYGSLAYGIPRLTARLRNISF